ncbi:MAG: hypothetical protein JWN95_1233 [Frankiales bacterium]|nr:hypothetical protein [Frankiales bacterium]
MNPAPSHRGRRDNGLDSDKFLAIADVDPRLSDHLLDVLGLRQLAAYVEPAPQGTPVAADRVFVAADRTDEGRTILGELAAELGISVAHAGDGVRTPGTPGSASGAPDTPGQPAEDAADEGFEGFTNDGPGGPTARPDPLAGVDTDAVFAEIVSGLGELNRPLYEISVSPADHAVATNDSAADEIDEVEHFIPPPAPPIPKMSFGAALAVLVTLVGILTLAFGSRLGLPADVPLPLGVVLILFGTVMLVLRLRPEPWDDPDDDGAVV